MARAEDDCAATPTARGWGQSWQVPLFLLGLAAVAGVAAGRPLWHDTDARRLDRALATGWRALEADSSDPRPALNQADVLLELADRVPGRTGEVHALIGTAQLRAAEQAPAGATESALHEARRHLDMAIQIGVPESLLPPLQYHLARAWHLTGGDARAIIDWLLASIDRAADNRAEAYAMLCSAYLRLRPPDLTAALEANQRQISVTLEEEALAPVRLQQGEILLQLRRGDEARAVLQRIKSGAAPQVYRRALLLRADSCQQDRKWADAAGLWEELLARPDTTAAERGRFLYYLGVCDRERDRKREAADRWEAALGGSSEGAQAAALALGRLRLEDDLSAAVLGFERALRDVATPEAWHNELICLEDARRYLEQAWQECRNRADYDHAAQFARLAGRLGPPGVDQERLAETAAACAESCRTRAANASAPEAERLRAEAARHSLEAAAADVALADLTPPRPDRTARLRSAAERSVDGGDHARAAALLLRGLQLETEPRRVGDTLLALAEAYRALGNADEAAAAYHKAIEYPGPAAFRARLRLAEADIARQRWDDAEKALAQNLELMRAGPVDNAVYEKSLFALADLRFQRGKYRLAATVLLSILDRYPGHPREFEVRLRLADCWRKMAEVETQRKEGSSPTSEPHYEEQRRRLLQKAGEDYRKLVEDLIARRTAGRISAAEEAILRQAQLSLGECLFQLGRYEEAVHAYGDLAGHSPDPLVRLNAHKQVARCWWLLRNWDRAGEAVEKVRVILKTVPDAAFPADGPKREDWQTWLDWAAEQRPKAAAAPAVPAGK